jgi:flagellar biogenesis protein FliO
MFEDMAMATIYVSLNAAIIMLTIFTWHVSRLEDQ